jgi:hypothetical protein
MQRKIKRKEDKVVLKFTPLRPGAHAFLAPSLNPDIISIPMSVELRRFVFVWWSRKGCDAQVNSKPAMSHREIGAAFYAYMSM